MIRLSPGAHRYLHIVDERFELHGAACQLFEDFHTPGGVWPRPIREWPGWSEGVEHAECAWGYRCRMPQGPQGPSQVAVIAEPGDGEVTLQATLRNSGGRAWQSVIAECCLNVRPFLWHDSEGERIRIFTDKGPLQVSEAEMMICPERPNYIYHTFAENRTVEEGRWGFKWGPKQFGDGGLTLAPITEGMIVANLITLNKTQLYIGMAWDRVAYLWTSFTNCMHCTPMFGNVAPGETSVRHGKIYVTENLDSLVARYRADFPSRGQTTAPARDHGA